MSQAKCIEAAAAPASFVCVCVCTCTPEIPQTEKNMQITRLRDWKRDEKQYTDKGAQTMKKGSGSAGASLVSSKVSPREKDALPLVRRSAGGLGRRVGRRGKDRSESRDATKYIPAGCVVAAFNKLASNKEELNRKSSRSR